MHETRLRVRWSDLDPYGHVNHAAYLTYLEEARIAALESIGWGMGEIERLGLRVVVTQAELHFHRSAAAGEELVVASAIEELRPASSRWRQEIRCRGTLILEAEIVGACTDPGGRPRRVPAEFQTALGALGRLAPPAP